MRLPHETDEQYEERKQIAQEDVLILELFRLEREKAQHDEPQNADYLVITELKPHVRYVVTDEKTDLPSKIK